MLISTSELDKVWNLHPKGVLHVGAHEAEEAEDYIKFNWGPVTWIEAQSNLALKLQLRLDPTRHKVIHAAVWNENGVEIELKITNNSQSTSLLELGTHQKDYPDIHVEKIEKISTLRADSILTETDLFEFVNLDIQGAELRALQGLGDFLDKVNAIYTEVNKKEVYIGCAQIDDLTKYLETKGFKLASIRWIPGKGWGDALFLRTSKFSISKFQVAHSHLYSFFFYTNYYYNEIGHRVKNAIRELLRKI